MAFYSGQKVVCVNAAPTTTGDSGLLVEGNIYTIMSVFDNVHGLAVNLYEINPEPYVGFHAWRFRPVVDTKTDISVFTGLQTPNRIKEDA